MSVTMTKELEILNFKLEYYTKRKASSMFSNESTFYNEMITKIENEIEEIVLKQLGFFDAKN